MKNNKITKLNISDKLDKFYTSNARKHLDKKINTKFVEWNDEKDIVKKSELEDKLIQLVTKRASFIKGYGVEYSNVDEFQQALITNFSEELIIEGDITDPKEISLCHIIANAYSRIMQLSGKLSSTSSQDYISQIDINYLKFISKEIDRAEKQYLNALNTLHSIKQPPLKVNIKTNNAFIADKQLNQHNTPNENK